MEKTKIYKGIITICLINTLTGCNNINNSNVNIVDTKIDNRKFYFIDNLSNAELLLTSDKIDKICKTDKELEDNYKILMDAYFNNKESVNFTVLLPQNTILELYYYYGDDTAYNKVKEIKKKH